MPKVIEMRNEQKLITIPSKLAKALDIKKGERLEFKINKNGNLELVRESA